MTSEQLKIIREIVRRAGLENLGYEHVVQHNSKEILWIDAVLSAPVAQALPLAAETADQWYLQDTRSYTGNDVMWWAKDGKGYTSDINKAHVYEREEAFRQAAMRGTDRAWPKAYIDGKTRPAVDIQYINHAEAIAMQGEKA